MSNKISKIIKKPFLFFILGLFLVSCQNSEDSILENSKDKALQKDKDKVSKNTTFEIILQDGYIKNAKVFADKNKNNMFDTDEIYCQTDTQGKCTLNLDDRNYTILSEGGVDTDTNKPFLQSLSSSTDNALNKTINLTSISTLAQKIGKEKAMQLLEIVDENDLYIDYIKNINEKPELYKKAFKLQKLVQLKGQEKLLGELKTVNLLSEIYNKSDADEKTKNLMNKIDSIKEDDFKDENLRKSLAVVIDNNIKNNNDNLNSTTFSVKQEAILIKLKEKNVPEEYLIDFMNQILEQNISLDNINDELIQKLRKPIFITKFNENLQNKIENLSYEKEINKQNAKNAKLDSAILLDNDTILFTLDNNIIGLMKDNNLELKTYDYESYTSLFSGSTTIPKIAQIQKQNQEIYILIHGASKTKPSRGVFKVLADDIENINLASTTTKLKKDYKFFKLSENNIFLQGNSITKADISLLNAESYINDIKNARIFDLYKDNILYQKETSSEGGKRYYTVYAYNQTSKSNTLLPINQHENGLDYDRFSKNDFFKVINDKLYFTHENKLCKSSSLSENEPQINCKTLNRDLAKISISKDEKFLAISKNNEFSLNLQDPSVNKNVSEISLIDLYNISDFDNPKLLSSIFLSPLKEANLLEFIDNNTLIYSSQDQIINIIKINNESLSEEEYFNLIANNIDKVITDDLQDVKIIIQKGSKDKTYKQTKPILNLIKNINGIEISYHLTGDLNQDLDENFNFLQNSQNADFTRPPFGIKENENNISKDAKIKIELSKGDLKKTIEKNITFNVQIKEINQ